MDETILTIVGSVIAALGSTNAWEYYTKRAELRKQEQQQKKIMDQEDRNLYRDDLRRQVAELREDLLRVTSEKERETNELRDRITTLSEELAAMRVRVEFLERENANLRDMSN